MKQHMFNSRALLVALSLLALVFTSGCTHYVVSFDMDESGFKPKGTSIAVISGTKEPDNVTLAELVSDSLRKKSRYQVLTAAQISKALAPYPQNIKGPYKSAYFSLDIDWTLGDHEKIAAIQRALGVDYLYVIWAPIEVSSTGAMARSMPAVAQLFERPNSREVAKANLGFFVGDFGNVYLREGVEELTRRMAEDTKMAMAKK